MVVMSFEPSHITLKYPSTHFSNRKLSTCPDFFALFAEVSLRWRSGKIVDHSSDAIAHMFPCVHVCVCRFMNMYVYSISCMTSIVHHLDKSVPR